MTPRERVQAAIRHGETDRIPRFEIWIDALQGELGEPDPQQVYVTLGQDGVPIPGGIPKESPAWGDGVDEWGRVWKGGMYADGALDTEADLERFSPPLDLADRFFIDEEVAKARARFPDHCLFYGTHLGPFTAAYLSMGFQRFFLRLRRDPAFIRKLLEIRTAWCIHLYRRALRLGAEVLILGDDAAHGGGPMISPPMWRDLVLPLHRRIVEALDAPVIWHSDGNIEALLPMAVEAG
ncbi:MAG: uroporphyrinogen decarboxylase family protein, partial [Planctomycetota bacterium]